MRALTGLLAAILVVPAVAACGASGGAATVPTVSTVTTPASGGSDTASTTTGDAERTTSATSSDDATAYAEALADRLAASGSDAAGRLVLDREQARCVAPGWVSVIGLRAFTDADIAPADVRKSDFRLRSLDLDTEQGATMIAALEDCGVDIYKQLLDVLSTGLDAKQRACLRREFDPALARRFLADALIQDDLSSDLAERLDGIDTTCKLSAS